MSKSIQMAVMAALIVGALAFIVAYKRRPARPGPPVDALGELVAEETTRLLDGHGQVVALIFDLSRLRMRGLERSALSFEKALPRTGLTLLATETLSLSEDSSGGPSFRSSQLLEVLRKHSTADAVVCFGGAPFVNAEDLIRSGESLPPLVSVMTFPPGQLRALFAAEVLELAFLPRSEPPAAGAAPVTGSEGSGSAYLVVTPEAAASSFPAPAF